MRKFWIILLVLVVVTAFATTTSAETAVERIKRLGVLKIGSTSTGVPTTFLDTETGKISGIMVDVGQAIADHLGVELEVVETPWASLIPSLQSKKIDLICAAMSITEKRKQVIDFSDPIYPYAEALVVKESDTNNYEGIDDIRELKIGAQVGTIYAEGLEKQGIKNLKIYDSIQDIFREINIGRIDAGVVDAPVGGWLIKTKPEFKVRMVKSYVPVWRTQIGAGVHKDNKDLLEEVNKAVKKLHEEGKIEEILAKWGQ